MKTMAVLAGCILAAVGVAMAGRVVQPLLTMDGVIQADTSAQADRATYADGAGTATATNLDAATRTLVAAIAGGIISTSVPPTPTSVSFATNAAWAARLGTATNWVETDSNGTWQVTEITPPLVLVSSCASNGVFEYNGPPNGTTWSSVYQFAYDDSNLWRLEFIAQEIQHVTGTIAFHGVFPPYPASMVGIEDDTRDSWGSFVLSARDPVVTNRVRIATTNDFPGLPFVPIDDTRYLAALTNAAAFATAAQGSHADDWWNTKALYPQYPTVTGVVLSGLAPYTNTIAHALITTPTLDQVTAAGNMTTNNIISTNQSPSISAGFVSGRLRLSSGSSVTTMYIGVEDGGFFTMLSGTGYSWKFRGNQGNAIVASTAEVAAKLDLAGGVVGNLVVTNGFIIRNDDGMGGVYDLNLAPLEAGFTMYRGADSFRFEFNGARTVATDADIADCDPVGAADAVAAMFGGVSNTVANGICDMWYPVGVTQVVFHSASGSNVTLYLEVTP